MPSLRHELVFIETDQGGREFHKTFPVGSSLVEPRGTIDQKKWADEVRACESAVREYARRGQKDFSVFFLDGRPRLIREADWNPNYERDQALREAGAAKRLASEIGNAVKSAVLRIYDENKGGNHSNTRTNRQSLAGSGLCGPRGDQVASDVVLSGGIGCKDPVSNVGRTDGQSAGYRDSESD